MGYEWDKKERKEWEGDRGRERSGKLYKPKVEGTISKNCDVLLFCNNNESFPHQKIQKSVFPHD